MKILVIGDLHGRKPKLKTKNFDIIILVGDICCDREIGKFYKKWFNYLSKNPNSNYNTMENFLEDNYKNVNYDNLLDKSLKKGRKILEYFNSFEKPVYLVPGNWDQSYGPTKIKDLDKSKYSRQKAFLDFYLGDNINKKLITGLKNIYDCQYKLYNLDEFDILGYGLSSCPEKLNLKINSKKNKNKKTQITQKQIDNLKNAEKKIKDKLKNQLKNRDKNKKLIFISHNIPYNTSLDIVKNPNSYANNLHLGSSIAREFCIYQKPFLCVGGHIHEGGGEDILKDTKLINPGFLGQVLVEIQGDNFKEIKFLTKTKKDDFKKRSFIKKIFKKN